MDNIEETTIWEAKGIFYRVMSVKNGKVTVMEEKKGVTFPREFSEKFFRHEFREVPDEEYEIHFLSEVGLQMKDPTAHVPTGTGGSSRRVSRGGRTSSGSSSGFSDGFITGAICGGLFD